MSAASPARAVATRVLHRVEADGAWAMPTLDSAIDRASLSRRDAALATEIVYGTLRTLPRIDASLDAHLRSPKKTDAYLRASLRAAAYQLEHLARVPSHAVVSDAVTLVRGERGARLAGVANAVLRKLARARPERPERPSTIAVPTWLAKELEASLGAETRDAFLGARRLPPPLGLRAVRESAEALAAVIAEARPEAEVEAVSERGVKVRGAGDPRALPGYGAGRFAVQELGAQAALAHLEAAPGDRVADLCAGRGTKSLALREAIGEEGTLIAVDLVEEKLERLESERRRLALGPIETRAIDLSVGLGGLEPGAYDRVLLDAPCTGVGTVHRRPELLLRLTASDPSRLADTQHKLLRNAAHLVRPGGRLVYVVCSPLAAEGDDIAEKFEQSEPSFGRCADARWCGADDLENDAYRTLAWVRS